MREGKKDKQHSLIFLCFFFCPPPYLHSCVPAVAPEVFQLHS